MFYIGVITTVTILLAVATGIFFLVKVKILNDEYNDCTSHLNVPKANYIEFLRECTKSAESIWMVFGARVERILLSQYNEIASSIIVDKILSDIYENLPRRYSRKDLLTILLAYISVNKFNSCNLTAIEKINALVHSAHKGCVRDVNIDQSIVYNIHDHYITMLIEGYLYHYINNFDKLPEWEYKLDNETLHSIKNIVPYLVFDALYEERINRYGDRPYILPAQGYRHSDHKTIYPTQRFSL